MKVALALWFSLLTSCSFSQSILEPHNPAPRVGDQLDLTVYFQKENLTVLQNKSAKTTLEQQQLANNRIATGSLRLSQVVQDTGIMKIGPLTLTFNGTTYTTDEISIRVSPALPAKASDGLWIRIIEHDDYQYLIIEQRIANQWKKVETAGTITLMTADVIFSEFDQEKFEGKGLDVVSSSSSTDNQSVDKNAGFGTGSSAYKITILKFSRNPQFQPFKLDRKFFSDLPKAIKVEDVWIR